jgi:hypothetical protein
MSYQERRAIVGILATVLISAGYAAFMLPRHPIDDPYSPTVFRYWGEYFVVLIVVSIVVRIIIAIVFSILNTIVTQEREPSFTDERDKLIELKAMRNGFYGFVVGFMLAMLALMNEQPPSTMFLILLAGGIFSELISHISEFWFYRWGI